jgi:hypothetical protein
LPVGNTTGCRRRARCGQTNGSARHNAASRRTHHRKPHRAGQRPTTKPSITQKCETRVLLAQTSLGDGLRVLLFSLAPALLILVSYVAALVAGIRKGWRDPGTIGLLAVSLIATVGHLYLSGSLYASGELRPDWWFGFALFAYWCTTLLLVTRWALRRQRVGVSGSPGALTGATVLGLILLVIFIVGPPIATEKFWLPRERLIFTNEVPFTGYVLRVSEDRLVILNDDPRIIVQKPKGTLQDRDFCYPKDHKARSSKVAADSPACP